MSAVMTSGRGLPVPAMLSASAPRGQHQRMPVPRELARQSRADAGGGAGNQADGNRSG